MTPFHLNNKTILVTGASSGIGQQVAISISNMGGNLVCIGRDIEKLKQTMKYLKKGQHQIKVCDLTEEEQVKNIVEQLPLLDGIVNCAGTLKTFPIKFLNKDKIKETFSINYEAQVLLTSEITKKRKLKNCASIVFLSSISANHPYIGGSMYSGSKAAIEAFSKTLAIEFCHQGIRSNCLSPAMVKTPMYDEAEKNVSKEKFLEHVKKYPLGVGTADDVANAAVFLLSDASRWISGININLDGGFLLGAF